MDEEDTPSMRDLVRAIDAHVEMVDLEVMSNIRTEDDGAQNQTPPTAQSTKDIPRQLPTQTPPSHPAA